MIMTDDDDDGEDDDNDDASLIGFNKATQKERTPTHQTS